MSAALRPLLPRARRRAPARGFTLVEMMVALTIGVVMVGGFAAMFVGMKSTYRSQDSLAQLQDGERLTLQVLNAQVQQAGYYPDSLTSTRAAQIMSSIDTTYGTWVAGRSVFGTASGTGTSESFQTAFAAQSGDGLLNCLGGTNTSGANVTYRNIFTVDTTNNTLRCKVLTTTVAGVTSDSGWQNLVGNVSGMSIRYGVDTNGDGAVDLYLAVGDMTSAYFDAAKSMRVTLSFLNTAGNSSSTVSWTHTVNLMNTQ